MEGIFPAAPHTCHVFSGIGKLLDHSLIWPMLPVSVCVRAGWQPSLGRPGDERTPLFRIGRTAEALGPGPLAWRVLNSSNSEMQVNLRLNFKNISNGV